MFRPELIKEQWEHVAPKIREMFPKLNDQDLREVNGNFEVLVSKLTEKYGLKREEIVTKITPVLAVPAVKSDATPTTR